MEMEKAKCKKCGQEFPRLNLVIVQKELVCPNCFPEALSKLFNKIRSLNAQRESLFKKGTKTVTRKRRKRYK